MINSMHDMDRGDCEACNCCKHEGRFELEGVWVELCGGCARALREAAFTDEKIAQALRDLLAMSIGRQAITAAINATAVKHFAEDFHGDGGTAIKAGLNETIVELMANTMTAQTDLYRAVMAWCAERKKEPAT